MKAHHKSRKKLNDLLAIWPKGVVAVTPWLRKRGVSRYLANAYHRSGWVRRIGRGAYARLDDKVAWTGGLHAVQYQLDMPVHLGGKRALERQGYGHFVRFNEGGFARLFGTPGTRLPAWFKRYDWGVKIEYTMVELFRGKMQSGLTEREVGDFQIRLSAPERAMLELLYDVPDRQSFEEARLLMQGLTTLRPELVRELLEACRSVKAKRLFLFLAEEQGHAWMKDLDVSKVDLGSGKLSVVKGGRLDSKYQMTVEPNPEPTTIEEIP